jgi:monothiol glutaredoxin
MAVISLHVRELEARLQAGDILLVDVRTPQEWAIASIAGARLLDDALLDELRAMSPDTPIAFLCHHGIRSHSAALHFVQLGFQQVHNVVGGIDAWSLEVDPSTPRY